MKALLLFDADLQHYRRPLYAFFARELARHGYALRVVYDRELATAEGELFTGIRYGLRPFCEVVAAHDCRLVILFVWLRYRFLIPFMLHARRKGIRMITWSHGINLQRKRQPLVNQLYYLRQRLADALVVYSEEGRRYVRADQRKVFVACNTLDFGSFPPVRATRDELKARHGLAGKKVVLCVGRLNLNNRKPEALVDGFERFPQRDAALVLVGPGLSPELARRVEGRPEVRWLGPVHDPAAVNELFAMSDLFCMPGAIGLALNQAFYHGLPVVLEDVAHGPEACWFRDGENGLLFREGDVAGMMGQVKLLLEDDALRRRLSSHGRETILREATPERMLAGFLEAIRHADR